MLAQCPHCNTVFRITAEQLKVAHGQVRCGVCFNIFDALDHLHQEEDLLPRAGEEASASPQELPGPSIKDTGALPEWTLPSALVKEKGDGEQAPLPVSLPVEKEEFSPEFTDEAFPASRWSALAWGISGTCLLGGLLTQAIWFHGDALADLYPPVRLLLEGACKHWGCEWVDRRDLGAVRLLSQDVRQHPRYQKTLLVNASLVNEASFTQPYPILQLSLYDTSGTMLAAREFKPEEYLDASISMEAGMKPGQPVHIVLEVVEPDKGVVSYEFGFL